ncbi:hypothetical protein [Pleionea sediminis]|uniref:hypothetical protein n=1 Tax=Pleionea sediminis TaxID=2569479 RepID=UPI0011846B4E|nr:hypothetical protein [Pleionea sediminis]
MNTVNINVINARKESSMTRARAMFNKSFAVLLVSLGASLSTHASIIEVDFDSQFMGIDSSSGEFVVKSSGSGEHVLNKLNLFCNRNAAEEKAYHLANSENFEVLLPEVLSRKVTVDGKEICVGQQIMRNIYDGMDDFASLYTAIDDLGYEPKAGESFIDISLPNESTIRFKGTLSDTRINLSTVTLDDGKVRKIGTESISEAKARIKQETCRGFGATYESSTNECVGKKLVVNDMSYKNFDFWQIGKGTETNYTDELFNVNYVPGNPWYSLSYELDNKVWEDKYQHYKRLIKIDNSTSPATGEYFYYCRDNCPGVKKTRKDWFASNRTPLNPMLDTSLISAKPINNELKLHVMQVGPGNCLVVECPGPENKALVVDCGETDGAQTVELGLYREVGRTAEKKPKGLLHAYNILKDKSEIDVYITHGDADHHNLLDRLLNRQHAGSSSSLYSKVKRLLIGGQVQELVRSGNNRNFDFFNNFKKDYGHYKRGVAGASEKLLYGMDRYKKAGQLKPYQFKQDGETVLANPMTEMAGPSCGTANVKIAAVNRDPIRWSNNKNGQSMIIELSYDGKSIVLPGDAERTALLYAFNKEIDATLSTAPTGDLGGQYPVITGAYKGRSYLAGGSGTSTGSTSYKGYTYRSAGRTDSHIINKAADILVAPHHGALTNGSDDQMWMDSVKPKYLVYSHGFEFGHPARITYTGVPAGDAPDIELPDWQQAWPVVTTSAGAEQNWGYFNPTNVNLYGTQENPNHFIRFDNPVPIKDGDITYSKEPGQRELINSNTFSTMINGHLIFTIKPGTSINAKCLGPTYAADVGRDDVRGNSFCD